ECRVINSIDNFTHTIFIAEVIGAENLPNQNGQNDPPMTYAYYHKTVKGKTPKNAPGFSAVPPAMAASGATANNTAGGKTGSKADGSYKCGVCGYVFTGSAEEFKKLPLDFVCPVCGAAKSKFEEIKNG
ncbi:MAG: rubredoxin, partial [Treponema sp.]|nr:rubredoxin [Treponema sp.]